ncbi:hypothetical protein [Dactylosporangium sp. CA-233914]|uniref:hypothetical protein n=1 Tax=Dactylosporangium sp. CA-233914 TaxID=3239934 RepID=UPI003D93C89B
MFSHFTAEALQALQLLPGLAEAAGHPRVSPADLAAALATHRSGNTAALWSGDPPPPPKPATGSVPLDKATKAVLERSFRIAAAERAEHIGTEHLLAALVRTAPADTVAWLAERGATAEAVDARLAELAGGPGAEQVATPPSARERRRWKAAAAEARGERAGLPPLYGILLMVAVVLIVLALCVWSGP